jgi:hypothetical protein
MLSADWPALLDDVRKEEVAARTFVFDRLIPFLKGEVDLGPVSSDRLLGTESHRRMPVGQRSNGQTSSEVTIGQSDQLISLIRTRGYLSEFILSNYAGLRRGLDVIRTNRMGTSNSVSRGSHGFQSLRNWIGTIGRRRSRLLTAGRLGRE